MQPGRAEVGVAHGVLDIAQRDTDVREREADVLAASQRLIAASVFNEKGTVTAKANVRARYLRRKPPRFLAQRAGRRQDQ